VSKTLRPSDESALLSLGQSCRVSRAINFDASVRSDRTDDRPVVGIGRLIAAVDLSTGRPRRKQAFPYRGTNETYSKDSRRFHKLGKGLKGHKRHDER